MDSPAAKMIFKYEILNAENKVVCTGKTVQVFVDKLGQGELWLSLPKFFEDWKRKVGLIK